MIRALSWEVLRRDDPFPHIVVAPVLSETAEKETLEFLDSSRWRRCVGPYYCFDAPIDENTSKSIWSIVGSEKLYRIQSLLRAQFDRPNLRLTAIDLQRYSVNSGIGPHTDATTNEVRLVLNINARWSIDHGNIWILASDSRMNDGRILIPPVSNTGLAFDSGPDTFHALSVADAEMQYAVIFRYV